MAKMSGSDKRMLMAVGIMAGLIVAVFGGLLLFSDGSSSAGLATILFVGGLILVGTGFYFLPVVIAGARHHHQVAPILIVNLFFGWTFIGWVAALAWSFSAQKKTA
jgi:hypothetical protein